MSYVPCEDRGPKSLHINDLSRHDAPEGVSAGGTWMFGDFRITLSRNRKEVGESGRSPIYRTSVIWVGFGAAGCSIVKSY